MRNMNVELAVSGAKVINYFLELEVKAMSYITYRMVFFPMCTCTLKSVIGHGSL